MAKDAKAPSAAELDAMSRDELQALSDDLAEQRTAIRLQQVEVNSRLDVHRDLDRLGIDPARLTTLSRIARVRGSSASEQVKQ
jgi:hypothetical protein